MRRLFENTGDSDAFPFFRYFKTTWVKYKVFGSDLWFFVRIVFIFQILAFVKFILFSYIEWLC